MTVERDPRATTAQQGSKGLILLKKQTSYLSKALILRTHEIGTFCIDCTGTPSSLPNAGGIGFGAVTGDNLDGGMGVKPRSHGFRRAIFQHVNGTAPLEIDNDGAVAMAFAPCPIIHPNDFRFWPPWQRHATHTPQEGVATPWDPMTRQVPRAGSAAEGQARVGLSRG
jgi:hypothetical protein